MYFIKVFFVLWQNDFDFCCLLFLRKTLQIKLRNVIIWKRNYTCLFVLILGNKIQRFLNSTFTYFLSTGSVSLVTNVRELETLSVWHYHIRPMKSLIFVNKWKVISNCSLCTFEALRGCWKISKTQICSSAQVTSVP